MPMSYAVQATPPEAQTQPMSATTAPAPTGGTLDVIGALTTIHLALIALLALIVLAAIVHGVRQRARHRAAEREEQVRMDSLGDAPVVAAEQVPDTVAQEERRPLAAPAPAASPRGAKPHESGAPVPRAPRHDPVPSREDQVAFVAAEPTPLTRIKGLGPKVAARLAELGVTRVDQIAALSDDEADALDAQLGAFRGRIARDRWVEQARFLAAGDIRGFEAVFGRL